MGTNNQSPAISIIMPCYNSEKYIRKTLYSVFGQTFTDYEVIFINDGSTDSTLSILNQWKEQYSDRVEIISKENGGQSMARNIGMTHARGEYIVFWDSDDYADVDYLEKLYTAAQSVENCETVISGSHYVDENGVILENLNYPVDVYPEFVMRRLSPHGKMYQKAFLDRYNIRFAEGKIFEDNPFNFLALFLSRNQVILPYCGHYQVIHTGSTMSTAMRTEKMPYDAMEDAMRFIMEHKDEVNNYATYEFVVLSFLTYFIFLGNREHMQAANKASKGYKNKMTLVYDMCDFALRAVPKYLPKYWKNKHVGILKDRYLQFRHRAGVWLFVKLLRTRTLKLFAKLYYKVI